MSRQWIWVKTDTPPKCKLTKWQKQPLVAKAEECPSRFPSQPVWRTKSKAR